MVECPGLSGLWNSCPRSLSGLQPFEIQAFGTIGVVLIIAVLAVALLTAALVLFTLMND